jgi:hypothetical protein
MYRPAAEGATAVRAREATRKEAKRAQT